MVVEEIRQVMELPAGWSDYDVAPDDRIVVVVPVHEARAELRLITNWCPCRNVHPSSKSRD